MRVILAIALFGIFFAIVMNYNFEYDAVNPEQSIYRMTYFMSNSQKNQFDMRIISLCQDDICSNLDGLTVDEINDLKK